jgi:hypothetical protein
MPVAFALVWERPIFMGQIFKGQLLGDFVQLKSVRDTSLEPDITTGLVKV